MMKALTVYQPHASLIELNEKKYETRSWATSYQGPILVHSAKNKLDGAISYQEPFYSALKPLHKKYPDLSVNGEEIVVVEYPEPGSIIAVANLVNCYKIDSSDKADGVLVLAHLENYGCIEDINELAFGDYTPGRYAWELANVHRLKTPIPAKGRQRLWNWDESEHQVMIDPWVVGSTRIWTPEGVRSGKRITKPNDDAIVGLEVTG